MLCLRSKTHSIFRSLAITTARLQRYSSTMTPTITLEEHYTSTAFLTSPRNLAFYNSFPSDALRSALSDLSSSRLAAMDAGAVTTQIISHGAGTGNAAQCRAANDQLRAAVDAHPDRFRGFAALPMAESPAAAVAELERCVAEMGFVGTLLENHLDEAPEGEGVFFDAERFWPVFETAQRLDVAVYLHPASPTEAMEEVLYRGNYPENPVQRALGAYGFGWHALTGLHVLRMYAAGVFDRFPRLKIVIGHMGELLPFQLDRILKGDNGGKGALGRHERGLKTVWDSNIWVTTSGMFSLAPLACLLATTAKDRMMYSVDYPFSSNETGKEFLNKVDKRGLLSAEDFEGFKYKNASRLLKLNI